MGRTILSFLAALGAVSATLLAQPDEIRAAQVLRSVLLQKQPESVQAGVPSLRVMMQRDAVASRFPEGRSIAAQFGEVALLDVDIETWSRLRTTLNSSQMAVDQGFDPSELSPSDLAHATELHRGLLNRTPLLGRGVLLAIYDSGIDWSHETFRRSGDSIAIAMIWDQTEAASRVHPPPQGRSHGRLYERETLLEAIRGERSDVTTSDQTGHGTAVAALANAIAPEADLIIIKGGNEKFSESGLVEALAFLDSLGLAWKRPVVLNLSFGSRRGPHDGSLLHERAIDVFTERPGRVVVAAAGNDGGLGLHAEGAMRSPCDSTEIAFAVPGGTPAFGDGLDLEIWFMDTTGIRVEVQTPTGRLLRARHSGTTISVDEEGVLVIDRPAGGRQVTVQLSDAAGADPLPGTYRLRVRGGSEFHAWITRSRFGTRSVRFLPDPLTVTERMTVQSPATSSTALAVGSTELIDDRFVPAAWSSAGPRADGRPKPEIAAPGSCWLPSLGRRAMGTSISSPIVAGAASLLCSLKPQATSEEVRSVLVASTDGPIRQIDASAAVAVLLGRSSFSSDFIDLQRPTSETLSWNGDRLSNLDRIALVDRSSAIPLAAWTVQAGSGQQVFLTEPLARRVDDALAVLTAVDRFGRSLPFDLPGRTTDVIAAPAAGSSAEMGAYPNPFNASTTVTTELPASGEMRVSVYSIDGREVACLHDGPVASGQQRWTWTSNLASGVYFLRSEYRPASGESSGRIAVLKLVMMR